MSANRMSDTKSRLAVKSLGLSPGNPTMMSVVDARIRALGAYKAHGIGELPSAISPPHPLQNSITSTL